MAEAKEGRGLGRALGFGRSSSDGAESSTEGSGVGIVIADSVSDSGNSGSSMNTAPMAMNGASSNGASKASENGEAKGGVRVQSVPLKRPAVSMADKFPGEDRADEAPIPRSRLGRSKGTEPRRSAPRVRRARLKVVNIDPWSVMKVSFLFSVAFGLVLLVAVALLWAALDFMGFFSSVGSTITDVSGDSNSAGFDVVAFFSLPRVMGMATVLALINTLMITALATLATYMYNLSTDLVGGVEVTLAEEE
ncbi:MAG: DUF3566 domain-containing protein [Sporichthyaceae bacterium]